MLAVDTSGERGGVAVLRGRELLEVVAHAKDGFAHVLFGHLERALAETGVGLHEVDAFAAASGPGSFTGVRVALSAMKGLAEACGRPLFAVSNLQALAWYGGGEVRAPVMDARRGEIYGGLYDARGQALRAETVGLMEDFERGLPEGAELVRERESVAGAVAWLAAARWERGERPDPAGADANYVRRSDAELKWVDG